MKSKSKTINKRTILQIPLKDEIRSGIETIALKEGFDSIQAFTRFVYTKIINKEISISVLSNPVKYVSKEYEDYLNKREKETLKAIKEGKSYVATSADEFIDQMDRDEKNKN
jgi:hypothetical protein